jgi:PAS domain S-box-containing protein
MKLENLNQHIALFEKNKIAILKSWLKDERILLIIKKYSLDKQIFIKKYAFDILNYYLKVIKGDKYIGECPCLKQFISYLNDKNITTEDLFIICVGLKNSFLKIIHESNIASLKIEKELNYLYEENFQIVLNSNAKSLKEIETELIKSSDIVDRYIIALGLDLQGNIKEVSKAFCELSGFEKEELVDKSLSDLKHPNMDIKVYETLWKVLKEGEDWKGELENNKKEKGSYWLDVIITKIYDKTNTHVGYELLGQNITSKKELQEQQNILIEQSKSAAMGEMISMIAHQWRQPLQTVSILTQKLPLHKITDGEISDELLDSVVDGITVQLEYMSKTIDDFRDFFLPHKTKETVQIKEVIDKALEFINFMLKTDSIEVNITAKSEKKISIYVNELIQVLINILKNARDVMVEKSIEPREINIVYYEEDSFLTIEIEDNAGGIPEGIITKVFEPYFSTKSEKNGTGLGLYMSKTIVEKHSNGHLSVSNSKKGAVFSIKLPLD